MTDDPYHSRKSRVFLVLGGIVFAWLAFYWIGMLVGAAPLLAEAARRLRLTGGFVAEHGVACLAVAAGFAASSALLLRAWFARRPRP